MGKLLEALYNELSLRVRQLAWLNVVRNKVEGSNQPPTSRMEAFRDQGIDPEIPPAEANYLASILFEIGPVAPAGMGVGPISLLEAEAWMRLTGVDLNSWEIITVRRLSVEYAAQLQEARDPACPEPCKSVEAVEKTRAKVANQFKKFMSGNRV